ncbi:MAG: TolC family protein [Myxococcaceae bacterium]|nr:TolC family protein [Myxococcaceae bacterium]
MIGWVVAVVVWGASPGADRPLAEPSLVPVPGAGPLLHKVALTPASVLMPSAGGALGNVDGSLSLTQVLSAADRAFPSVAAALADVAAADAEAMAAWGGFDPVVRGRGLLTPPEWGPYPQFRSDVVVDLPIPGTPVNVFGGYRFGVPLGTDKSGNPNLIQPYYQERLTFLLGEVRGGVNVPVLRNLFIDRRRASIQRSELGQEAARQAEALQRIEVARLAAFRYWDWVAAGMRREVARDLLRIARDRDRQLATRVRTGDVPLFDQQDNLRAVAQRESLVVQAQRQVEQTRFELSLYWRDGDGQPVQVGDTFMPKSIPDPDPTFGDGAVIDEAIARRPDLRRLVIQQQQQRIELSLQRNQLLPAVDLGAVITKDLGTAGTADPKLEKLEVEFGAVIEVPILYRLARGRIDVAQAQLARIEAQLQLLRDRVGVDVTDALSALKAARERVQFTRKEVDVAQKLEAGERQKFELGDSNLLFVNIRETQTAEARLREIDALTDYHRAVASFRAAMAL